MSEFLSYSSVNKKYADILDKRLKYYGANPIRDTRNLHALDDIPQFMDIAKSVEFFIALISIDYLKSDYCIYEFTEFLRNKNSNRQAVPILLIGIEEVKSLRKPFWRLCRFLGFSYYGKNGRISRLHEIIDYLSNTRCLIYNEISNEDFKACREILRLSSEKIIAALQSIKIISDHEQQDILIEQLLIEHPGEYFLLNLVGHIFQERKQFHKAIFYYEKCIVNFKKPYERTVAYYHIARCYLSLQDYQKAVEISFKSLAEWSFTFLPHRSLGDAYYKLNDLEKAKSHYLHSLEYQESHIVYNSLGIIEDEEGNFDKALKYFQKSIKIEPKYSLPYNNIYHVFIQAGKVKEAGEWSLDTMRRFPENSEALSNYGEWQIVQNSSKADITKMIAILEKSINLEVRNLTATIFLGHLLSIKSDSSQKELYRARKLLTDAFEMGQFFNSQQRRLLISALKLCCFRLKDNGTLKLLKKKYNQEFILFGQENKCH